MTTTEQPATAGGDEWVRIIASVCGALVTAWALWLVFLLFDPAGGPLTLRRVAFHATDAAALLFWWAAPFLLIATRRRSAHSSASLWIRSLFLPFFLFGATWGWVHSGRSLYLGSGVAFLVAVVIGFAVSRRAVGSAK